MFRLMVDEVAVLRNSIDMRIHEYGEEEEEEAGEASKEEAVGGVGENI